MCATYFLLKNEEIACGLMGVILHIFKTSLDSMLAGDYIICEDCITHQETFSELDINVILPFLQPLIIRKLRNLVQSLRNNWSINI